MSLSDYAENILSTRIIRQDFKEVLKSGKEIIFPDCTDELDYINGVNELAILNDFQKERYATSITVDKSIFGASGDVVSTVSASPYPEYTRINRPVDAGMFDYGYYEQICTRTGTRICKTLASLFTAHDQYWEFLHESEMELATRDERIKSVDAETAINAIRAGGNFMRSMTGLDFMSVALELGFLHVYSLGYRLSYDTVVPSALTLVYGEKVTEKAPFVGMKDREREPDENNLNDASAVIIQLRRSNISSGNNKYLAYIGANDDNLDGMCVTYEASKAWPIPLDSEKGKILDSYSHIDGGDSCNPLTWLLNYGGEDAKLVQTEYPIVMLEGGSQSVEKNINRRLDASLCHISKEIDDAWSSILKAAKIGAKGKEGIQIEGGAASGMHLPKNLERPVLQAGQKIVEFGRGAGESLSAAEVVKIIVAQFAGGRSVPGYVVLGNEGSVPETGIALAIQTAPLVAARDNRIKTNQRNVDMIYDIERALLIETNGAEKFGELRSIEQRWNPGTWSAPEAAMDKLLRLEKRRELEVDDHVVTMRMGNNLRTDAEAIQLIEKFEARSEIGDYGKGGGEQDIFAQLAKSSPGKPPIEPPPEETEEEDDGKAWPKPKK